jgi:hypothetical protein
MGHLTYHTSPGHVVGRPPLLAPMITSDHILNIAGKGNNYPLPMASFST